MTLIITENTVSRRLSRGKKSSAELVFDVFYGEDQAAVLALLEATAPAAFEGLVIETQEIESVGGGVWKAYARYQTLENDNEWTFSTRGGSQKITQSLATIASYAPAGMTPPDFGGAIGVTEDRVEGVDIVVPKFSWTETHRFADAAVDDAYKVLLHNLTGCTNNGTFRTFPSGSVRFEGVDGSKRGDELWTLTFTFSASPNLTGVTIGDITGIDKEGQDYLWTRYADYEDSSAKSLVKRPISAHVERVSPRVDFDSLGI